MKKILTQMIAILVATFWGFSVLAEQGSDLAEELTLNCDAGFRQFTTVFPYSDFNGIVYGVSFGAEVTCLYSIDSYCIVDGQWNIVSRVKIDHPHIKDEAAYINKVVYDKNEGVFHLLVFDHLTCQSYVVLQAGTDKPQYGSVINKEIHSFDIINNDYIFAGLDETLHPWIGRFTKTGDTIWEQQQSTDFFYHYCAFYDEELYFVSSCVSKAIVRLEKLSADGEKMICNEYSLSNLPLSSNSSTFDISQVDISKHGITIFGQIIDGSGSRGSIVKIDENYDLIELQTLDNYRSIQGVARIGNSYLMLVIAAEDSNMLNRRYVISDDLSSVVPLESQDSQIDSLGLSTDFEGHLYLFGAVYPSDMPTEPSTFISEITPSEWKF